MITDHYQISTYFKSPVKLSVLLKKELGQANEKLQQEVDDKVNKYVQ